MIDAEQRHRAEQIANRLGFHGDRQIEMIADALAQVERETREKNTTIAEKFAVPEGSDEPYCLGWETACRGIAAAIRQAGRS